MKKTVHFAVSVVALGFSYMTFGANNGCNVNIVDETGSSYDSSSDSYSEEDATENNLTVSGSGEYLTVGYNTLAWTARLNWQNGMYFFAPDPAGDISGNKIICAASIDENEVEGDCFRSGRVCHFNYWHDDWNSVDNKDVYYLGTTTCKKGGDVGPFLVPLDSPLCGDDPFPSCPSEDIFPTGPDVEDLDSVDIEEPADTESPTESSQPVEDESGDSNSNDKDDDPADKDNGNA